MMVIILHLLISVLTDLDLPHLSPEDRGKCYDMLSKVSTLFHAKGLPFWGISGTLLGAVRHGGMIPWDDDIDLVIHYRDKYKLEKLRETLSTMGLTLFIYDNYFYKIFPQDGRPVIDRDGNVTRWKYPFIDIFAVNLLEGHICIVSHNYPHIDLYPGWYLYPHEIAHTHHFVPFGPLLLPIPRNPAEILTREYGPDWFEYAYFWGNHEHETSQKTVKVPITDYSPAPYILPNLLE